MRPLNDNHYLTAPNERITVNVRVDKLPYLCVFEDPPEGSAWEGAPPKTVSEKRSFLMPTDGQVAYDASYDTEISKDDPDPQATYTITISGSNGGERESSIVVPRGAGPINISYYFRTLNTENNQP